jgi:molybdate transport system substrate-binding protein
MKRRQFMLLVGAAANLLLIDATWAAEINVLASGGTKEAYLELVPEFEKNFDQKTVTTWSGSVGIKKRIADGEVYDLVIMGAPEIDAFIQQGKMVAGSRVDLMKSGVGVAVRAGAPKPDVSSIDTLKKRCSPQNPLAIRLARAVSMSPFFSSGWASPTRSKES